MEFNSRRLVNRLTYGPISSPLNEYFRCLYFAPGTAGEVGYCDEYVCSSVRSRLGNHTAQLHQIFEHAAYRRGSSFSRDTLCAS